MNVTEPIIQAALLGTANREFVPGAFPESLQTLVDGIHGKAEDTESFLYMTAASAFAYRRAGWEPAGAEGIVPVKTAADFLRLEQFPAAAEEERFAGREQFGERFKVVHFQIGTFQRRQAAGKEVRSEHTVPAFLKDTVTAFLAVPHLAPGEVVHGLSVKVHARSHQELHGCFPVLKLHHVVQSCDEDRLVITFAAFYIAEMLPAYISHPLRIRQFNRFLEQKVYK